MLVRRIARPLLAAPFVYGGISTLRKPQDRVPGRPPGRGEDRRRRPTSSCRSRCPRDVEQWVKADAAVKVVAGSLFALGRLPAADRAGPVGVDRADDAGRAPLLGARPTRPSASGRSRTSSRTPACSAGCCWPPSTPRASRRSATGPAAPRTRPRTRPRRASRRPRSAPPRRRRRPRRGQEGQAAERTAPARGRAPEDRLPPGARPRAQLPGAGLPHRRGGRRRARRRPARPQDPHQHPQGPQGRRPEDGGRRRRRRTRGRCPST